MLVFRKGNSAPGREFGRTRSLAENATYRGSNKERLFSITTRNAKGVLETHVRGGETWFMRALAGMLVFVGVAFGVYYVYLKRMPVTDEGTAPTQAISLTGVRGDLLQIAQAERGYMALNSGCVSLDELVSSNSLAMAKSGRDGYLYSITCSAQDFTVTARHEPAPAGSPIRYPNLAIDQNMQIAEVP